MATKTIRFELVTPQKPVLKTDVLKATIPTKDGELTILPDHIPLVAILKAGVVEIQSADERYDVMAVSGGFLEVLSGKIVILADYAERADDLDEKALEEARLKAEVAKKEAEEDQGVDTEAAWRLDWEVSKGKALSKWRHLRPPLDKN